MAEGANRDYPFENEPKRRSVHRERRISDLDMGDEFTFRQIAAADRHSKPLMRFLRSKVGQPWRQVQSEIDTRLRALKVDAPIRRTVRERVMREVDTDVAWRESVGWVEQTTGRRCSLFAHPESGELCLQKRLLTA